MGEGARAGQREQTKGGAEQHKQEASRGGRGRGSGAKPGAVTPRASEEADSRGVIAGEFEQNVHLVAAVDVSSDDR